MKKILFIVFVLFIGLSVKADVKHKKTEKIFKAKNMKELIVENSYGQVEVEQWDKDVIKIKVDIKVDAGSMEKVNSILNKINISFVQKADYLNVVTEFSENFKLSKFSNAFFSGGSTKIDYVIYMPKNIALKLANEQGNVFIGNFDGKLSVDVKDGDLKIGKVLGQSSINVNSGSVNIENLGKATCLFEDNKEVSIAKVDDININSKHSNINITEANKIVITSSKGNCNFGTVTNLRGSSSMTDYIVQDVSEELVFDLWFGSLNVRNIHNMFSLVDVKTVRARTGLTFMQGAAYDIAIRHHKNVKLDLPAGMDVKRRNTAKKKIFISEGKYGGINNFKSKVKINASGCKFYIQ